MKKILIFFVLFFLPAISLGAASLKGGYPVCVTKELYDQARAAILKDDKREVQYLFKSGCFAPEGGASVTLLELSEWSGVAKVRIFAGGEAFIMWTSYKNIKKE